MNFLPGLNKWDRERLEKSIKEIGIQLPVTFDQHGRIIDGYHRKEIAEALNVEYPTQIINIKDDSEYEKFAIDLNLARRQLSFEQISELRKQQKAKAQELREGGATQKEAAEAVGVTHKTVSKWENNEVGSNVLGYNTSQKEDKPPDNRIKIDKSLHDEIWERRQRDETAKDLAEVYGVSKRTISSICSRITKKKKREQEIDKQKEEIQTNNFESPAGKFDVIVLDPPWPYGTKYDPIGRRAANPYPEMSLDEIKAIELPTSENCVLWLWTTHKFMRYSFELLDHWEFRDVAILTWVKDRMGLGSWLRSQSEFCIMAVKGKPKVNLTNQTTIIHGKMREHSRKPDEFYQMIDKLCFGYKIDWFSREKREGWSQYGSETNRFVAK